MFDRSVNSKTSILVIAVASLFASGPILGTQQALATNAGGSGFGGGGGSFVSGTGALGGSGVHAGFVSGSHGEVKVGYNIFTYHMLDFPS
jgi:hypothetical protein